MSAAQYIGRIRNDAKREYAARYWRFLCDGSPDGQEPDRGALGVMGAQSVRLTLTDCLFELERKKTL